MSPVHTYTYPSDLRSTLLDRLIERGFEISDAPYSHFRAQAPGCTVTFYESGKLVIQGREAETFAEVLAPHNLGRGSGRIRFRQALDQLPGVVPNAWIGADESGKGDYFGPLAVCAARVEPTQLDLLAELGVADCKSLSDPQVNQMAPGLKALCPHQLVVIGPERYNTLYRRLGSNLNRLLAWAHARAIESLLEAHPNTPLAIIDRFGPHWRIEQALMTRGRAIRLIQRHRAEDDPAVAVASVLARHAFLSALRAMSKSFAMTFPKGAGPPVIAAAREFVRRHGEESLHRVAKVHFKTTQRVLTRSAEEGGNQSSDR